MMNKKIYLWLLLWYIPLYFECSTTSANSPNISAPFQHRTNGRSIMLVLPVMQGEKDPTDPRLHFWFTKAPVTIMINDDIKKKSITSSQPAERSTTHRQHTNDTSTTSDFTHDTTTFQHHDLEPTTAQPNLQVTSAEPKWESELHNHQENEKRKLVKLMPMLENSTVLPSSTRFHQYNDFIPRHASFTPSGDRTHTTENPLITYELLKKVPLKPLPLPDPYNMDVISPQQKYFDVLNNFVVSSNTKNEIIVDEENNPPSNLINVQSLNERPETTTETVPMDTSTMSTCSDFSPRPVLESSTDKLIDDFKMMLTALGILSDNKMMLTVTTDSSDLWRDPDSFTTDPLSYRNFKRIPSKNEMQPIRQDIQLLLGSFGIIPKSERENSTLERKTKQSQSSKLFALSGTNKKSLYDLSVDAKKDTNATSDGRSTITHSAIQPSGQPPSQHNLGFPFSGPSAISRAVSAKKIYTTTEKILKRENNSTAPLDQLDGSFGDGKTSIGDPTDDDLTTPQSRGLYFFVDWNKFLNVAESAGTNKEIKLKFAPRVGNPRYFVPVKFP